MRARTTLVLVLALLSFGIVTYMDEPGSGSEWGVFYACLPDGCGWYLCWPGASCRPA